MPGCSRNHFDKARRYRAMGPDRLDDFLVRGFRREDFFPHLFVYLPKGGPDAYRNGVAMCDARDPAAHFEVVLHATSPAIDELPGDLFFDRDVIWHEQHFGLPGHVASANLIVSGSRLFGNNYISDLVQRTSGLSGHTTLIRRRFQGWIVLLINAILNFANERGIKTFYSPTAELMACHTNRGVPAEGKLFDRIYDRILQQHYEVERSGLWWRVDLGRNANRLVAPEVREGERRNVKTLCVCHDIERALGHLHYHRSFAQSIEVSSRHALDVMLGIEGRLGVRATYHVVGCLMNEVRAPIERGDHSFAFHSFDHGLHDGSLQGWAHRFMKRMLGLLDPRLGTAKAEALRRCREVDLRVKGYRPPQSFITREISDANLNHYGFEWLASGAASLGTRSPHLRNGIAKVPILFDDFDLHCRRLDYDQWLDKALRLIETHEFVAFGLHDCYADHWLPHYERLLEVLLPFGRVCTLDQVSAEILLAHAL
ncbi:MAG: hypothetical protein OEU36_05605 [Gammaproteobacteria bacterium]|nr:hypothetical protein [Gammaproteobacteria bacterium]